MFESITSMSSSSNKFSSSLLSAQLIITLIGILHLLAIIIIIAITTLSSSSSPFKIVEFVEAVITTAVCDSDTEILIEDQNQPLERVIVSSITNNCRLIIRNCQIADIVLPNSNEYSGGSITFEDVTCHSAVSAYCIEVDQAIQNFNLVNLTNVQKNVDESANQPTTQARGIIQFTDRLETYKSSIFVFDGLKMNPVVMKQHSSGGLLRWALIRFGANVEAEYFAVKNCEMHAQQLQLLDNEDFDVHVLYGKNGVDSTGRILQVESHFTVENVEFNLDSLVGNNVDLIQYQYKAFIYFGRIQSTLSFQNTAYVAIRNIHYSFDGSSEANGFNFNTFRPTGFVLDRNPSMQYFNTIEFSNFTMNATNINTAQTLTAYLAYAPNPLAIQSVRTVHLDDCNIILHDVTAAATKSYLVRISELAVMVGVDSSIITNSHIRYTRSAVAAIVSRNFDAWIMNPRSTSLVKVFNVSHCSIHVDGNNRGEKLTLTGMLFDYTSHNVGAVYVDNFTTTVEEGVVFTQPVVMTVIDAETAISENAGAAPTSGSIISITNCVVDAVGIKSPTLTFALFRTIQAFSNINYLIIDNNHVSIKNPRPDEAGTPIAVTANLVDCQSTVTNVDDISITNSNFSVFQDYDEFRAVDDTARKINFAEIAIANFSGAVSGGVSRIVVADINYVVHVNATHHATAAFVNFEGTVDAVDDTIQIANISSDIILESQIKQTFFYGLCFFTAAQNFNSIRVENTLTNLSLISREHGVEFILLRFASSTKAYVETSFVSVSNNVINVNLLRAGVQSGQQLCMLHFRSGLTGLQYLSVSNSTLTAATTLSRNDPSTPLWAGQPRSNIEVFDETTTGNPIGAIDFFSDDRYATDAHTFHILKSNYLTESLKNNISFDACSIIASSPENDADLSPVSGFGSYRRRNFLAVAINFNDLQDVPLVSVTNTFIDYNSVSYFVSISHMWLTGKVMQTSIEAGTKLSVKNTVSIVNGSSTNPLVFGEAINVLLFLFDDSTGRFLDNLTDIEIIDSNITIREGLNVRFSSISALSAARINVSNILIDGLVFNLKNLRTEAYQKDLPIAALLSNGKSNSLFINESLIVKNVFFQNLDVFSAASRADVNLVWFEPKLLDSSIVPLIEVTNISGTITQLASQSHGVEFSFIKLPIFDGWGNVTLRNVSNFIIESMGVEDTSSGRFSGVAIFGKKSTFADAIVDADNFQNANILIDNIDIRVNEFYSFRPDIVVALRFMDPDDVTPSTTPYLRSLNSIIVQNITANLPNLQTRRDAVEGTRVALIQIKASIENPISNSFFTVEHCLIDVYCKDNVARLDMDGISFDGAISGAIASSSITSDADSRTFLLVDDVTVRAKSYVNSAYSASTPNKVQNILRLLYLGQPINTIYYPFSGYREDNNNNNNNLGVGGIGQGGAIVVRNCHSSFKLIIGPSQSGTLPSSVVSGVMFRDDMNNVTTINVSDCSTSLTSDKIGYQYVISIGVQFNDEISDVGIKGGTHTAAVRGYQSGVIIDRVRVLYNITTPTDSTVSTSHPSIPLFAGVVNFGGAVMNIDTIVVMNSEVTALVDTTNRARSIETAALRLTRSLQNNHYGIFVHNNTIVVLAKTSDSVHVAPLLASRGYPDSTSTYTINFNNAQGATAPDENFGLLISENTVRLNIESPPAVTSQLQYPHKLFVSAGAIFTKQYEVANLPKEGIQTTKNKLLDSNFTCTNCYVSGGLIHERFVSNIQKFSIEDSEMKNVIVWSVALTNGDFGSIFYTIPTINASFAIFGDAVQNIGSVRVIVNHVQNVSLISARDSRIFGGTTTTQVLSPVGAVAPSTVDPKIMSAILFCVPRDPIASPNISSRTLDSINLANNIFEDIFLLTPFNQHPPSSGSGSSSSYTLPHNYFDQITLVKLWTSVTIIKGQSFVGARHNVVRNNVANKIQFFSSGDQDNDNNNNNNGLVTIYNVTRLLMMNNTLERNCFYNTKIEENRPARPTSAGSFEGDGPQYNSDQDFPTESLFDVPFHLTLGDYDNTKLEVLDNVIDTKASCDMNSLFTANPRRPVDLLSQFETFTGNNINNNNPLITNFSIGTKRFSLFHIMKRNPDQEHDEGAFDRFNNYQTNFSEFNFNSNKIYCDQEDSAYRSCSLLQIDSQYINASLATLVAFSPSRQNRITSNQLLGVPDRFKIDDTVFMLDFDNNASLEARSPPSSLPTFDIKDNTMRHGQVHTLLDRNKWTLSNYPSISNNNDGVFLYNLFQSHFIFGCNYFENGIEEDFNYFLSNTTWKTEYVCNIRNFTKDTQTLSLTNESTSTLTRSLPPTRTIPRNSSSHTASMEHTESNFTSTTTPSISLIPEVNRTETHEPTQTRSHSPSKSPSNSRHLSVSDTDLTPSISDELEETQSLTKPLPKQPIRESIVKPVPATLTLVTSVTSMATGASVVGPLAIRNGLILGVLGCGQDPEPLDLGTHPTQMELATGHGPTGDDGYKMWRGVILGNFLIIAAFGVVVFAVPFFFKKTQLFAKATATKSREEHAEEISVTIFNKLLILWGVGWIVLSAPATSGVAASLAYGTIGTADNTHLWLIVIILGPFISAVPPVVVTVVCWRIHNDGVALDIVDVDKKDNKKNASGDVDKTATKKKKNIDNDHDKSAATAHSSSEENSDRSNSTNNNNNNDEQEREDEEAEHGACVRGLLKIADFFFASYKGLEWPLANPFVKRWGFLFEHTKLLYVAYLEQVLGFLLNIAVGMAQGKSISALQCRLLAIFICLIQIPMFLWVIILRPMLTRFDQYVSVIMYTANIITAALVVVEVFKEPEEESDDITSSSNNNKEEEQQLSAPLYSLSMAQAVLNLIAALSYLTYFVRVGFRKKLQKEEDIQKKIDEGKIDGNGNNTNDDGERINMNSRFRGESKKLGFDSRWEELMQQGQNGEVDDDFVDIIADVLALPSHEIDDDFADMLDEELNSKRNTETNFNKSAAAGGDEEIDLSMLLDDDKKNNNQTATKAVVEVPKKEKKKPKLDYELDESDDAGNLYYQLDDDEDEETKRRREQERGIGASRNEELEMRRLELQGMLSSFAANDSMAGVNPAMSIATNRSIATNMSMAVSNREVDEL